MAKKKKQFLNQQTPSGFITDGRKTHSNMPNTGYWKISALRKCAVLATICDVTVPLLSGFSLKLKISSHTSWTSVRCFRF